MKLGSDMIVKAPLIFNAIRLSTYDPEDHEASVNSKSVHTGRYDNYSLFGLQTDELLILTQDDFKLFPKNKARAAYHANMFLSCLSFVVPELRKLHSIAVDRVRVVLQTQNFLDGSVFFHPASLEKCWVSCYDIEHLKGFII